MHKPLAAGSARENCPAMIQADRKLFPKSSTNDRVVPTVDRLETMWGEMWFKEFPVAKLFR